MLLLQLRRGSSNGNKKLNRGGTAGGSPTGAPPTTDALESTTASAWDNKRCYRAQLEQEVLKLQQQLQEEINLHVALANAAGHNTLHLLNTSCHLPDKAQELLSSVAALEITVSKLEDELVSLHFRLSQERNVRHLAEHNVMQSPSPPSHSSTACCPSYSWDEQLSSLRISKCDQIPDSLQPDSFADSGHSPSSTLQRLDDASDANLGDEKLAGSCMLANGKEETDSKGYTNGDLSSFCLERDLYHHPNRLSEEMVRCMRNIFLCLSESSTVTSKISSLDCIPRPSSPNGHLSFSSLTSFSSSSAIPSLSASPSTEICNCCEDTESARTFDPYRVHGKVNQTNIGSYSSAAEVSWMTVGEKQLEYAAKALKQFRFLVEQLAKVNPAVMTCNQRLAFWINLYNALIMHAYLAYGVPKSDMKLFSLMQKASYTVGGHSFSAADIEYVILKMKPPAHRPQIALILALHKFKISEEHRKYSIDDPEPLAVFALSCGMYSSPAIQIFTADNIKEELQISLRDYVRASVGINDKGKLLVPKLVHCFAKGVVEDSLLVDWICRFLTPEQLSLVRDSASQRKQRLLGARGFTVVPFESRFRYLFLPDKESPTHSS